MAPNEDGPSFFAQFIDNPEKERPRPTPLPTPQPALRLLDWLQHTWNQPTIRARDIYRYGPHRTRGREGALELAEILVKRGWLIPLKSKRRDVKRWQITIGPV